MPSVFRGWTPTFTPGQRGAGGGGDRRNSDFRQHLWLSFHLPFTQPRFAFIHAEGPDILIGETTPSAELIRRTWTLNMKCDKMEQWLAVESVWHHLFLIIYTVGPIEMYNIQSRTFRCANFVVSIDSINGALWNLFQFYPNSTLSLLKLNLLEFCFLPFMLVLPLHSVRSAVFSLFASVHCTYLRFQSALGFQNLQYSRLQQYHLTHRSCSVTPKLTELVISSEFWSFLPILPVFVKWQTG